MGQALSEDAEKMFDAIAGILLRCFIFTVLAMLFVWLVVFLMGDMLYQIYSFLFDLSRKEFDRFILYSLTFVKALYVVFFLIPFVAIKHFLRGKNRENRVRT
jgi:hypothetical protein